MTMKYLKSCKKEIRKSYNKGIKNVSERLYTHAKARKNQNEKMKTNKSLDLTKRSMMSKKNKSLSRESGIRATDRLYYWGVKKQKMKEKILEEERIKKDEEIGEELKAKPEINHVSKLIVENMRENRPGVFDRLVYQAEVLKEKKERLRDMNEFAKGRKYSFKPKVDKM